MRTVPHKYCCPLSIGTLDYVYSAEESLTFRPDHSRIRTQVHIVDDHILEGTQSFTLELEVPNASQQLGVNLGEYQEVQVDIKDNDSEWL